MTKQERDEFRHGHSGTWKIRTVGNNAALNLGGPLAVTRLNVVFSNALLRTGRSRGQTLGLGSPWSANLLCIFLSVQQLTEVLTALTQTNSEAKDKTFLAQWPDTQ